MEPRQLTPVLPGIVVAQRSPSRARILDAAVHTIGEHGYTATTVGLVCARARVSRRTFRKHFEDLPDCMRAILDDALERSVDVISQAFVGEQDWRDGLRGALAGMLLMLDSEPLAARVWLVEAFTAGSRVLKHYHRNVATMRHHLVALVGPTARNTDLPPLATESVMAGVIGLVQTHLSLSEPRPLIELLAPLTVVMLRPHLDPPAVERERRRAALIAGTLQLCPPERDFTSLQPPVEFPQLLARPNSHRVRACLRHIASHPGCSNREIAAALGVVHPPQISRLLSRLAACGLVERHSLGIGRRNEWRLSSHGATVIREWSELL